ncbi:hypothetical protein K523DRAFT_249350 [Schizophyllum commune Tattone D]|nr:hypothetical protein K523DRAFT_249350 [Schizophyllum commune Tattone D]
MTLLRDISRTVPSCDVQSLTSHIAAGAHFPDVFRAIRAQHRRFALDDSALGRPRYGRRINSYDELATEIDRIESAARVAREIRKGQFHCHNEMGPHNREVRACPCAKDFYCSGSCQRMNRHLHRGSCDPKNIWGMDGRLSVKDAMHIYGIASLFLQDHRDAISRAMRTLDKQMGRVGLATLTLNFAYDGSQAYEFEIRHVNPLLVPGRVVHMWVKMHLGGRLHIWDLPWSMALPPI